MGRNFFTPTYYLARSFDKSVVAQWIVKETFNVSKVRISVNQVWQYHIDLHVRFCLCIAISGDVENE